MDMCTWGDSTAVSVLSSVPHITVGQPVVALQNMQNKQKQWYNETLNQPAIIQYFQLNMGGVDKLYAIHFLQPFYVSNVTFFKFQGSKS